jgi:preprotein translocase subunit SecG
MGVGTVDHSRRAGRSLPRGRRLCVPFASMEAILSVIQVVISVVLIFLVLMHSGKDSGLSGAFGVGSGQGPLGGGSMVERNLNRWTVFFALLFVGNTILLLKKPWA